MAKTFEEMLETIKREAWTEMAQALERVLDQFMTGAAPAAKAPKAAKKPSQPSTPGGAGRGKKQCPDCQQYVGVRTGICACGHEFTKKPKAVVEPQEPEPVEAAPAVPEGRSAMTPPPVVQEEKPKKTRQGKSKPA